MVEMIMEKCRASSDSFHLQTDHLMLIPIENEEELRQRPMWRGREKRGLDELKGEVCWLVRLRSRGHLGRIDSAARGFVQRC